jgi:hypothetical protein
MEGVEREAPRIAAHVGFPLWLRRVSVFGLLELGYLWLGLGKGERGVQGGSKRV